MKTKNTFDACQNDSKFLNCRVPHVADSEKDEFTIIQTFVIIH